MNNNNPKNIKYKFGIQVSNTCSGHGHTNYKTQHQVSFTNKNIGLWQKRRLIYFNIYWSTCETARLLKEGFNQCIQG